MTSDFAISELFAVSGKVVVVTGGTRGIGLSIAEGFVRAGAEVFLCSRSAEACLAAEADLSQYGSCCAIAADLSTVDGCRAFVSELAAATDRVDVLINNAGATWAASLADYPESGWDKAFDINVKGPFFLIQAMLGLLKSAASEGDPARVINVGSINALHVPAHETYAYSASKAAVHQLSLHLAAQLAPSNITVNVIAPGMFLSKMLQGTVAERGAEDVLSIVPLKRFVSPSDMVGAAIYLSSKAGSYLTGVILPVDGGTATTV